MITLADALGAMTHPLASVVSHWHHAPAWRARAVRWAYPDLARALDELEGALKDKIGPIL